MELNQYEEKMKKSLANLEEEYGAIRAGRANPRILDRIQVDYYGISEDDQKQLEDKIQKLTDEYVKKIDQAIDAKSTEVMTV